MEPENRPEPPNLPAVPPGPRDRSAGPTPGAGYPPPGPPPSDPWATGRRRGSGGSWASSSWLRRLRPRSARLAVGLGLVGAAILLFPFAAAQTQQGQYAWWLPLGLGVGSLALITLLRLDRVLFGWAPHVAGVVLVGTLVWQTSANPWSWGLALGVGTVVAGLLLLPRWRVLAAGALLLVVFGIGYQFRSTELADQRAQIDAQAGNEMRSVLGVSRPQLALVDLDGGVRDNDPDLICRIVQDPALDQIRRATGGTDCVDAVNRLHGRAATISKPATEPGRTADPDVAPGATTTVDGCATLWAAVAGSDLGRVQLIRTDAPQKRFQVTAFVPC